MGCPETIPRSQKCLRGWQTAAVHRFQQEHKPLTLEKAKCVVAHSFLVKKQGLVMLLSKAVIGFRVSFITILNAGASIDILLSGRGSREKWGLLVIIREVCRNLEGRGKTIYTFAFWSSCLFSLSTKCGLWFAVPWWSEQHTGSLCATAHVWCTIRKTKCLNPLFVCHLVNAVQQLTQQGEL